MRMGDVSFGGAVKRVSLAYTPEAEVGDFVIVHAGFAISRLDQEEAERVFQYLDEIGGLGDSSGSASSGRPGDAGSSGGPLGSGEPVPPGEPERQA